MIEPLKELKKVKDDSVDSEHEGKCKEDTIETKKFQKKKWL